MTTATTNPRAFAVLFKELDRWDPASFEWITWKWPKAIMRPIGSFLRPRKEKVDRAAYPFGELQPITIHFDGSIDRREIDGNREYSMELFFARPGDVVVAKIDLKNGGVAIVPDWKNVAVTGHFAVYEPDREAILPEYFHRVIQTSFFKAHLWRNKVGAEGRKEVKLDFFEALQIPLLPLRVQRAIVRRWKEGQDTVEKARQTVAKIEKAILASFFKALELEPPKKADPPKAFAVWWKDFLRWSVSYNQAASNSIDLSRGKYPVVDLGSVLAMVQYGTSQKANTAGQGTPVIRMNNIVDGELRLDDLKHVALSPKERARLLLKDGDILFNRTNSKELVGKCAVFHEASELVFASYLIRVHSNEKRANPDYLATFISSPLGRQQIDALSRHIIGQANVNSMELRSLQVCLPPLAAQRRIADMVAQKRAEVARERQAAAKLSAKVAQEVEEMILGTRPVKGAKA